MSWIEFTVTLALCAITILLCRVVPLFVLKGRQLPDGVTRALNLIPPAAFAALVANDILSPGMFSAGLWPAASIFVAAAIVVCVALKTRSLLWSAVGGVVSYALLLMI